jgi:hypothetical protein
MPAHIGLELVLPWANVLYQESAGPANLEKKSDPVLQHALSH